MANQTKVVVTGANGFVGSHLSEYLDSKGFDVHCVVRKTSNTKWIDHVDCTIHRCGLEDIEALANAMQGARYVFHLAGIISAKNYDAYVYGNATLTEHVLKAALLLNKTPEKIVVISSLAAAGPTTKEHLLNEEDPCNPISYYGRSKVEQENICQQYMDRLPISIVRPPVVYGERDTEVLLFFKTIRKGLFTQIGLTDKWLSMIYVKDLVHGLYQCAMSAHSSGQVYFIADENVYNWSTVGKVIAQLLHQSPFHIVIPHFMVHIAAHVSELFSVFSKKVPTLNTDKVKEVVQEAWICSVDKAKKEIGYQQETTLEEGFKKTIDWYQKEKWL